MSHENRKIALLALSACVLWASAVVPIKITLRYAPPLFIAGIRFILSGLILLPFCGGLKRYFQTFVKNWRTIWILSLFQTVGLYGLFFVGMSLIPGDLGAIVIGSSPLTAALVSHFMSRHDRMSLRKSLSIAVGIGGIVFVAFRPESVSGALNTKQIVGIGLLVLASIFSAVGNVLVSRDKKSIPPLILNSSQILLGGLILLLLSLFVNKGLPDLSVFSHLPFTLSLGWISLLSALAFSIWFTLLKKPMVKVSELNIWKFVIPVIGAILAWIFLPGEHPDKWSLFGMGLVALSVFVLYWPGSVAKDASV